ncbi:hypothetical protein [Luteitalea sp.]
MTSLSPESPSPSVLFLRLPARQHRALRLVAAHRGVTVSRMLREYIDDCLSREQVPSVPDPAS